MNDKSINLVSAENQEAEKDLKKLKKVRSIAFFCLLSVAFFSVAAFLVNITLPIQSVKQDQTATLDSLFLLRGKLVKYYLIKNRVNNLSGIISQRKDYVTSLNKIFALLPKELSVDVLDFNKNTLDLTVSADSLSSINEFIDKIPSLTSNKKSISAITVQGIKLNSSTANYSLSLQMIIP